MGIHSKVFTSTKWGLGENVLRLMEYSTPSVNFDIFMVTISHLFVCLPTLELTTLEQHVRSTKLVYANALWLVTNSSKKKERGHFEQRT